MVRLTQGGRNVRERRHLDQRLSDRASWLSPRFAVRAGEQHVTVIEFGIMDGFGDVDSYATAADAYEQHICDAVSAEQLGYAYYFFIEHQNAPFAYVSAPSVYLAALAARTSTLHFGPMVYQLPMHHPIRLAQDAAMVDNLSRGRLEFGVGYGIHAHEFMRWELPFSERRAMGEKSWTSCSRPGPRRRSLTRANTGASTRRCQNPSPTSSPTRGKVPVFPRLLEGAGP
jgi:luciferase-like monooxygenase